MTRPSARSAPPAVVVRAARRPRQAAAAATRAPVRAAAPVPRIAVIGLQEPFGVAEHFQQQPDPPVSSTDRAPGTRSTPVRFVHQRELQHRHQHIGRERRRRPAAVEHGRSCGPRRQSTMSTNTLRKCCTLQGGPAETRDSTRQRSVPHARRSTRDGFRRSRRSRRRARQAPRLALDTEFMRERTYYAQPCLIQVASDRQLLPDRPAGGAASSIRCSRCSATARNSRSCTPPARTSKCCCTQIRAAAAQVCRFRSSTPRLRRHCSGLHRRSAMRNSLRDASDIRSTRARRARTGRAVR